MLKATFSTAILLIVMAVIFFFIGKMEHPQTLAPVGIGVLLGICAFVVSTKPTWRKHVMHIALLIALLGILSMIQPLSMALKVSNAGNTLMLVEVVLTMAICALYLGAGIRSFIVARVLPAVQNNDNAQQQTNDK